MYSSQELYKAVTNIIHILQTREVRHNNAKSLPLGPARGCARIQSRTVGGRAPREYLKGHFKTNRSKTKHGLLSPPPALFQCPISVNVASSNTTVEAR